MKLIKYSLLSLSCTAVLSIFTSIYADPCGGGMYGDPCNTLMLDVVNETGHPLVFGASSPGVEVLTKQVNNSDEACVVMKAAPNQALAAYTTFNGTQMQVTLNRAIQGRSIPLYAMLSNNYSYVAGSYLPEASGQNCLASISATVIIKSK